MTITKTQADIILGMARNIMYSYYRVRKLHEFQSPHVDNIRLNTAHETLDFDQRRLVAYLKGMTE